MRPLLCTISTAHSTAVGRSSDAVQNGFVLLTDLTIHRLFLDNSAPATASSAGFIAQLAHTGIRAAGPLLP